MTPFDLILHFIRWNSLPSVSVPNLKFLASTVREILGGSQNSETGSRDPYMTPFDLILHFILLNSLPSVSVPNLKFLASTVRELLGGSQNSKTGSRDPQMTPFNLILHFIRQNSLPSASVAKFKFLASTVREILGVPKFQNWVTWLPHDPFWPNFAFYSLKLTAFRIRAQFEVSSFNRSRDIRGSPKSKTGWRDPHMTPFDLILHFLR